ncbi:hypothetical protein M5K25_016635 [Dendrobium thyrsiflorum]|uniref:Uncharacterized protein n=1 Tax=Dendrobium thyrsiflorum TaxID=117978 RepID=A0ABD0UKN0_DENTH
MEYLYVFYGNDGACLDGLKLLRQPQQPQLLHLGRDGSLLELTGPVAGLLVVEDDNVDREGLMLMPET